MIDIEKILKMKFLLRLYKKHFETIQIYFKLDFFFVI